MVALRSTAMTRVIVHPTNLLLRKMYMETMAQLLPEPVWKSRSVESNGRTLVIMKMHHSDPHPKRVKMANGPSYCALN